MKRGFAVVEVISNCHVQYGRRNDLGGAVEMITGYRDNAVTVSRASQMTAAELAGKITIGVLADREMPISTEEYAKIRQRAREGMK